MNFIKQLHAAFSAFRGDDRLNPTHISLYMALFLQWNHSRFAREFFINRAQLMSHAKIGSKSTYHRCISQLHSWEYIVYYPSNNPYKGSKVKMAIIGTSTVPDLGHYSPKNEQVVYQHRPISGQALVSVINSNKQVNSNKQSNDRKEVFLFFKEKGFDADEGKKFYDYYRDKNWHTADGTPIENWQAIALGWMKRARGFSQNKKQVSHFKDNLKTTKEKDYGEPL